MNNTTKQSWKLNNAIRKYGVECFEVEDLGPCDLADADLFEQMFIKLHDTVKNGYNITEGGRGRPLTEGSRIQISKTLNTKNDARRLEKYKDADVRLVRLTKLGDRGIRVYVHEVKGRVTYTSVFGRHITLNEAATRTKSLALSLARGEVAKIHVSESLKDTIRFDN